MQCRIHYLTIHKMWSEQIKSRMQECWSECACSCAQLDFQFENGHFCRTFVTLQFPSSARLILNKLLSVVPKIEVKTVIALTQNSEFESYAWYC